MRLYSFHHILQKSLVISGVLAALASANPDLIENNSFQGQWTAQGELVELPSSPPATPIYTESQSGRTLSIHPDGKIANLVISASEMAKWNSGSEGFNSSTDRNTLSNALYGFFEDDFDFIFFINNNSTKPADINYYGQLISVSRSTTGISKWGTFDQTSSAGSDGRLQSFIHLPYLGAIQSGPTLHELAHNWANFFQDFEMASPGGNYAALPHWGWTGIPGQLGGFDPNTLVNQGGGNWQATNGKSGSSNFGGNANGGNSLPYANWELYLMGLMPVDSLDDITYFTNVVTDGTKYAAGEFAGTQNTYSVSQFINDRGPRVPAFGNAQTDFSCLFVVLSSSALTDAEWTEASDQVSWLIHPGTDASSLYNFYEATYGVGRLSANLLPSLSNAPTSSSSETSSSSNLSSSEEISSSSSITVGIQTHFQNDQVQIQQMGSQWSFDVQTKTQFEFFDTVGNRSTYVLESGRHTWEAGNRKVFIRYKTTEGWQTAQINIK